MISCLFPHMPPSILAQLVQTTYLPQMKNILLYSDEKIVSSDIVGNSNSSIYDAEYTTVLGKRIIKALNWYDNEWGYSNRVVDLILRLKDFG